MNYYKLRQLSLLQSAMDSYYKLRQFFYYKVLQSAMDLLQIVTGITKCDDCDSTPVHCLHCVGSRSIISSMSNIQKAMIVNLICHP